MTLTDFKVCLTTAALLALSYPPFPLGFLAPFALAIFLNYIIGKEPREAFRLGYVKGVLWALLTLFWIATNTVPGAIITILVTPLQYAVVWWLFQRIHRRNEAAALWSFPIIWTAAEYLRHFSDLRFNWLNIAYTQTYYLPFIQFIEWTGYMGLTVLLGYVTVLVYLILFKQENRVRRAIILAALMVIPTVYGFYRMRDFQNHKHPTLRVGVVQPNVDPFEKWDVTFQDSTFKILKNSTLELAEANPDLVVWPETATPFYLRYKTFYLNKVHGLVDSLNIHLITGTPDAQIIDEDDYMTYNAAFFFKPRSANFESYNKMALVPAAESMPFKKALPFLRKLDVGGGDFFSGDSFKVFSVAKKARSDSLGSNISSHPQVKVSTIICFESVFPHLVRRFVERGARILAIITNDGWFGNTSGPYQHAQYAVLRAVENRVSIARSANTGISFFIVPSGKKYEVVALQKRAVIWRDLPITTKPTFYTRHGDWLGTLCAVISIPLIGFAFINRRRKSA